MAASRSRRPGWCAGSGRDNRVLLRAVSYETVADSTTPIYTAVRASNNDVILGAFNVEAYGPDSAAVIEVSRFYSAPPPEIGARHPGSDPAGCQPLLRRAGALVPRQRGGRGDDHLPAAARRRPARAGQSVRAGRDRDGLGDDALEHDPAAGEADDAAARRQADRVLQSRSDRLRARGTAGPDPRNTWCAGGWRRRTPPRRSRSRSSRSPTTWTRPRPTGSSRTCGAASRPGRWPSRRPGSAAPSWRPTRRARRRIRTGRRRTRATPWCGGCRPPSRTRRDRTCTTRGPARFSSPTSTCTTTS